MTSFGIRGAYNGLCRTPGCPNPSKWVPGGETLLFADCSRRWRCAECTSVISRLRSEGTDATEAEIMRLRGIRVNIHAIAGLPVSRVYYRVPTRHVGGPHFGARDDAVRHALAWHAAQQQLTSVPLPAPVIEERWLIDLQEGTALDLVAERVEVNPLRPNTVGFSAAHADPASLPSHLSTDRR
ncbi:hypothetical protein [Saccharopolyspora rosea]|uniref:Uncharacterized protein n=1 Tax=Saccharopolyspora rosea TaxID=524884 RepID=A0ABW3FML1_9PSEU|nr:hypothetical protein [Saccharopolyspora rosea]